MIFTAFTTKHAPDSNTHKSIQQSNKMEKYKTL